MSTNTFTLQSLTEEEQGYVFKSFSRNDALTLGLDIIERAKAFPDPICVEITINGLVVFRYFMEGAILDSNYWLDRKRKSVMLMSMSSLRFLYWLEASHATLSDRKLNPDDYAACGGGYPIRIEGMDVVGSICVSGLPDHLADHQLITDALAAFLS